MDLVSKHVDLANSNSDFGSENMDMSDQTCTSTPKKYKSYKDI